MFWKIETRPDFDHVKCTLTNHSDWTMISLQAKWHDDVIKWKHFPRYWPVVRGIHRPPVNSPHKGKWRGALMFSFICTWINGWVNNREAGDLRRHRAHYDVIVMVYLALMGDPIWASFVSNQIVQTIESTSIRHRSDAFASDRCLMDVNPWEILPSGWFQANDREISGVLNYQDVPSVFVRTATNFADCVNMRISVRIQPCYRLG